MSNVHQLLRARVLDPAAPPSALLSEYTRSRTDGLPLDLRAEFNLGRMARGNQSKVKPSPRMVVLQEQLRKIEDKHRQDLQVLDEIQDFVKSRARLELEFAAGLQKLSQQFVAKRKWGAYAYKEDHDSILLVDLWRSILGETASDAKTHIAAGERLAGLAGETFEQLKEERRTMLKPMLRILGSLQEDLLTLDVAVLEAQRKYNQAMKDFLSGQKKKKEPSADMRKVMNAVQYARNDYVLELGCANKRYLKFRNEQFPEVADTLTMASLNSLKTVLKGYSHALKMGNGHVRLDKLAHCSSLLAPELERRAFLHDNRHEFPGRQLFEMEPYQGMSGESRDVVLDDQSRPVLLQIRHLMRTAIERIDRNLADKELQLESLYKLYAHYLQAGDAVGKSHAESMHGNMETLYAEMEAQVTERTFLEWKIKRITDTGIDVPSTSPNDGGAPTSVATFMPSALLDLAEAREREAMRRDPKGHFRAGYSVDGDSESGDYISIDGVSVSSAPYDPFGFQMRTAPSSPKPDMSPSSSLRNLVLGAHNHSSSLGGHGGSTGDGRFRLPVTNVNSRDGVAVGSFATDATTPTNAGANISRPMSMFNFDDSMLGTASDGHRTRSMLFDAGARHTLAGQSRLSEEDITDTTSDPGFAPASVERAHVSPAFASVVASLHRQSRCSIGGDTPVKSKPSGLSNGYGAAATSTPPPPLPPLPTLPAQPLPSPPSSGHGGVDPAPPPPLPPPPALTAPSSKSFVSMSPAAGAPPLPPPPPGPVATPAPTLPPSSVLLGASGSGVSAAAVTSLSDGFARGVSRRGGFRPDPAKKSSALSNHHLAHVHPDGPHGPGLHRSSRPQSQQQSQQPQPQQLMGGHGTTLAVPASHSAIARRKSEEMFGEDDVDDFDSDIPPFHRALYDYNASQEGDLSVVAGEAVYMLVWRDDGWNLCLNGRGEHGYVPQSYTTLEASDAPPVLPRPRIVEFMPVGGAFGFSLLPERPPIVAHVTSGSPAHAAGILPGDVLLEINSEPCTEMDADSIMETSRICVGYVRLCVVQRAQT